MYKEQNTIMRGREGEGDRHKASETVRESCREEGLR